MYRKNVIAVIMGGGRGSRLFPLTKSRSKPAVSVGGKYRLIDIPISNCINSSINRIFVLTQYNSESLNRHITNSYKFDAYSGGFVEVLAAEQTDDSEEWYHGTADAVRHNLRHYRKTKPDYIIILSGDQFYQMDLQDFLNRHIENNADISVSVKPVNRAAAREFGLLKINRKGKIVDFAEKPKEDKVLDDYRIDPARNEKLQPDNYLASMGIYIFNKATLDEVLADASQNDFGKQIIPSSIKILDVYAYQYTGYWVDIGTIKAFYDENIRLTDPNPQFSFADPNFPIYTHPRFLPPSKLNCTEIKNSIISDGCIINNAARLERSIMGIRSVVGEGTVIKDSYIMGADYYDFTGKENMPGIGKNCIIEQAIIDKNARIEDNVTIRAKTGTGPAGGAPDFDGDGYYIRDGIVIVEKDAVIRKGTEI